MRARQEANRRLNGPNLGGRATVDTRAVRQNRLADDVGFELLHQLELAEVFGRVGLLDAFEMLAGFGPGRIDGVLALLLVGQLIRSGEIFANYAAQFLKDGRLVGYW